METAQRTMMNPEEIQGFVRSLVEDTVGRDVDIDDGTELLRSNIVDSMGVVEMISSVERAFSLEIEPKDMVEENLNSIDNITAFLQRKADPDRE